MDFEGTPISMSFFHAYGQTLSEALQTQAMTALTRSTIRKITQPPHIGNPVVKNTGNQWKQIHVGLFSSVDMV